MPGTGILCSAQITTTTDTVVYTSPGQVEVTFGIVNNTGGSACTVSVSLLPVGSTSMPQRQIVTNYPLDAGDALPLSDFINGLVLGPGDMVSVQPSVANQVNVALSGRQVA